MNRHLPVLAEQAIGAHRVTQVEHSREFSDNLDDVTCRKGCTHCCHHPIQASLLEGVLLFWHLRNNGLWNRSLESKLEEHSALVGSLPPDALMMAEIPCPLLSESLCTAYSARPFLCRTIYSTGDPEMCRPARFSLQTPLVPRQGAIEQYREAEAEVLRRLNVRYGYAMPLSNAVLIGAKLVRGDVELEGVDREILLQYLRGEDNDDS